MIDSETLQTSTVHVHSGTICRSYGITNNVSGRFESIIEHERILVSLV